MTKLIAALAILAVLAWAVTATASWISTKKAPLAIAAGRAATPVSAVQLNKAMQRAQLRAVAAIIFALVMFAALVRVSVGLSGQAGLTIALTAGLSASGGLLMYSALPAGKLPETPGQPLAAGHILLLPIAALILFIAYLVLHPLASSTFPTWSNSIALGLAGLALLGSMLLALRRLSTTLSLPDPRMAAFDLRWRAISATITARFTSGSLLAYLGGTLIFSGPDLFTPTSTWWGIACVGGGGAFALAGAVQLGLAAKDGLSIRAKTLEAAPGTQSA
ncbi:hypothetical protein AAFM46_11635 [Arthrobacter sp. TMP15]|uniref:hypothetical protein n=1 Tax=Arthrobacter sp. TMP15 TaxID=3140789 RepID=UPI0031B9F2A1